jgi:hypothetical protein
MSDLNEKYSDEIEKLLEVGKEKEYLTYDDINRLLPPDLNSADEIEAILDVIGAEGISIAVSDENYIEAAPDMPDPIHQEIEGEDISILENQVVFTDIGAGTVDLSQWIIKREHTPRVADYFLSKLVPADQRESILGDMEEEYSVRSQNDGVPKAKLWYYFQAFSTIRLYVRQLKPIVLLQEMLKRRS